MTATATELERKEKAATVEERWDWAYGMLYGIWNVLRKGGVEGREIEEGVRDYMEGLAGSRPNPND